VRLLSQGTFGPGLPFGFRKGDVYQATVIYCLDGAACAAPYPRSIPVAVSAARFRRRNFMMSEPETGYRPVHQDKETEVGTAIQNEGSGEFTVYFERLNLEPAADLSKPLTFDEYRVDCSVLATGPTGPFATLNASGNDGRGCLRKLCQLPNCRTPETKIPRAEPTLPV
jgi:hypothetical protein